MKPDYKALENEVLTILKNIQSITLATCADNKVTARTMAPVDDGLNIMFGTSRRSEKAEQMRQNPNVALAAGNIQIEGLAELCGLPSKNDIYLKRNVEKFPQFAALYQETPDSMLVIIKPTKISLYKFIDGKACTDILDVKNNKAYRKILD